MSKPMLLSATVGLMLTVTACSPEKATTGAATAPAQPAAVPAELWSIEVMDGDKAVSRTDICADSQIREAFTRPAPSIGGQTCVRGHEPIEKDGVYSARCHVASQVYRVGAVTKGDTSRDFTVEMAVAAQGLTGPTFEQVRRYRILGPCPAGWTVGDSAAPGATQVVNSISGQTHALSATGG